MADGSLSQFKATLARKNARKEKNQGKFDRKKLGHKSSEEAQGFTFPQLSEIEMEAVKNDIREKIKRQKRIELAVLVLILFLGFLFLVYLNYRKA